MDRGPGARAAHTDAIGPAQILGELRGGRHEFVEILWRLDFGLLEHLPIVGDVVEFIAPWNAPLLRIRRAQFAARNTIPCGRGPETRQHVIPIIIGIRLRRILDIVVEIGDPAGRTIGPGHIGAGHEGIIFARAR